MAIVSGFYRFAFIHIPYCGGALVKAALDDHLRFGDVILGETRFGMALQPAYERRFGMGPFATLKQLRKAMGEGLDRLTTLALICDPELRVQQIYIAAQKVLGAYASRVGLEIEECKLQLQQGQGPSGLLNRSPIRAAAGARDGDDFVARLIQFSAQADGISQLSYAHWLKGPEGENVDLLFRTEQMDVLRVYLEEIIGAPVKFPIVHALSGSPDPEQSLILSQASRQRLREALRFDYELCERSKNSDAQLNPVGKFRL